MTATEQRSSWALSSMLFAVTGTLVVLAVAFALGLTWVQGQRLADEAVDAALSRSHTAQTDFRNLRFRELELIAQLLADEPYFANLIDNATGGGLFGEAEVDLGSINDQLADLRERIGFDFGMVMGPGGGLLGHTERPVLLGDEVVDNPLVARLVEELLPVVGFWREGGQLYQIAMVPMDKDASLIGFVAAGLIVDDPLLTEIKRVSGTDLVWMVGDQPVASTFPTAETHMILEAIGRAGIESDNAQAPVRRQIRLKNARWVASITPIADTGKEAVTAISVMSLDQILAAYRQMLAILLVGGGIAVVLALLASWALSRRISRPLARLADAAGEASRGQYLASFDDVSGSAEVDQLKRSFDSLLSELREKQDIEEYVADLSRYLPEPGLEESRANLTERGVQPEIREDLLLLALEYRGEADASDTRNLVRQYEDVARRLSTVASAHRAELELFEGQRAMLSFAGEGGAERALLTAAALCADDTGPQPAAALVSGTISRASVRAEGRMHRVLAGKAVLQADMVLEESRPGVLLMTPGLKDAVSAVLAPLDHGLSVTTGRLSARKYLAVRPGDLKAATDATSATRSQEPERDTDADPDPDQTRVATVGAPTKPALARQVPRAITRGDLFADRFEILSILGRGGMGMVYKAYDRELEDFVALKTLLPAIADDASYLGQLKEEIRLARRLTHPHVLRTYDFGAADGVAYISMEYVRGMTLRYLMEQKRQLPFSAGLRIARQLCSALAVAHQQGVIHRDIKPENLILEAAGNAKLMDFGIASPMQKLKDAPEGLFVGTPAYAAPEQMEGRPVDARADVYACGVLLYELFTGSPPFRGSLTDIHVAKLEEDFLPPDAASTPVPHRLSSIILRCMRRQPADRYADAGELGRALDGVRS